MFGSRYADHEFLRIAIHSPEQLRAVLEGYSRKETRLLQFESPAGICLGLAVDAQFGVVELHGLPNGRSLIARPDALQTNDSRCFVGDWQPSCFLPCHLLSLEDVIVIALETYLIGATPKWVEWER